MSKYKKLSIDLKSIAKKRSKIDGVFKAIEFQVSKLEEKDTGNIRFPITSPDLEWIKAIIAISAKALKTYRAIYTLCYEGYAPEAIPLVRVLFEAELTLKYICVSGKTTAFRFFSFIDFNRFEFYKRNPDSITLKQLPKGKRAKVLRQFEDAHKKHLDEYPDQKKNKFSWSGLSISQMAEEVDKKLGTDYKKHYLVNYAYYSSYSHSDAVSAREFISKTSQVRSVPDLRKIEVVFLDASLRILQILDVWASELKIESREYLDKHFGDIEDYISKTLKIS